MYHLPINMIKILKIGRKKIMEVTFQYKTLEIKNKKKVALSVSDAQRQMQKTKKCDAIASIKKI